MPTRLLHSLEVSDGSATLYLSGVLAPRDAFALRALCREIPARVQVLRLELAPTIGLEEGAMEAVGTVVRYWRESRKGSFRLCFAAAHLIATVEGRAPVPGAIATPREPIGWSDGRMPALTGMFL